MTIHPSSGPTDRLAKKFPRSVCPRCRKAVEIHQLDYKRETQHTRCPNGHKVVRDWRDTGRTPYGWTAWRLDA